MTANLFVKIIFILFGSISILAGLLNWKWFMQSLNARPVTRLIGYTAARLLYAVLGAAAIGISIFLIP